MADIFPEEDLAPAGIGFRPPIRRRPAVGQENAIAEMLRKIVEDAKRGATRGTEQAEAYKLSDLSGGLAPGAGGEPTGPATRRPVGFGGAARDVSLPILGPRSPLANRAPATIDNTGDVEEGPNMSAWPASGGLAPGAGGEPTGMGGTIGAPASRDLGELYRQRISGIQQPKGDLSPEQQARLRRNFFMQMLANNKPNSRLLQNAGAAGVATSEEGRAQQERNLTRGTQQQQFSRDEAYREMALKHQSRLEELQAERNKIDGTTKEGQLKLREIQAEMAQLRAQTAAIDPLDRSVRTIRKYAPEMTPREALTTALNRGNDREGLEASREYSRMNVERLKQGLPAISKQGFDFQQKYGSDISRKSAIYQQILNDPRIGKDTKKADALLQNELGVRVRD